MNINLKDMPARGEIILKGDPRMETYRRDAVIAGDPDVVVRPRDWQEVSEITAWCNGNKIPLTICGSRTSMSGSSVAEEGVLLTTENFSKVIDIGERDGHPYAITEPGVIVGEFQKIVEEKGYSYPTVPTSVNEALIGSTVATNATGEDFYKYGPTRNYIRELEFIKANGSKDIFTRKRTDVPKVSKGLGGYYLGGSKIDWLIGSEGTLGIISKVVVDLLPGVPETFIILMPFESNMTGLKFIDKVNRSSMRPRAMEFIDKFALSIMRTHKTCPKFPGDVQSLVYVKQEVDGNRDELIDKWFGLIEGSTKFIDETIIAETEKQKKDIHTWRHHIPSMIKEKNEEFQKVGGGKIEGDWWVPRDKILKMMATVYNEADGAGIDYVAYGHLGDGHPHTDYICKTRAEFERADELVKTQSRRAVEYGGGVAAEHGIGKVKRDLLAIQYTSDIIAKMRELKEQFDPNWILGRGNILTNETPGVRPLVSH